MGHRGSTTFRVASIMLPVLAAAAVCAALWQWSVRSEVNTISRLRNLPADSVVHLAAVVVGTGSRPGQFWIRDQTAALPVLLSRWANVRIGEPVFLEAVIAHAARGNTDTGFRKGSGQPAGPAQASSPHLGRKIAWVQSGAMRLSFVNAAPAVVLKVRSCEWRYRIWVNWGICIAALLILWLLILYRRVREQDIQLSRASSFAAAIRQLSASVLVMTRERIYGSGIPVPADPETAPLAMGVNAIIAEIELHQRARKEAESRMGHLALIDELTGLPNRRLLSDRLSQSLAKAQRDETTVALLCIDLDGFKLVNDRFGHNTGDALLAEAAQRLRSHFRQVDTLARLGGDEFALVLDKIQDQSDAQRAAESILQLLKFPFDVNGHSLHVTASIGISLFPDGGQGGQLLQQADCAMYAAKRSGKASIVLFSDDLGSAARERLTLEGELQHVLAKGEISVHYQPEFDVATNTLVRFEALARWNHPELGQIAPLSFIPVAEESGLIVPLGLHIMERACMDAVGWQKIAGRPIQVAVNVSSLQFARDSFFEEVADILHRTRLAPALLQIELTESAALADLERAAEMVRRLKRMGVSVAVDDFGTGYSSLSYLPRLSFDTIKLDRSFVREIMERRESRLFVKSILKIARDLHMKVIAEGVETDEQLKLISSLGTDEVQGFLLGRPAADPSSLLRRESTHIDFVQDLTLIRKEVIGCHTPAPRIRRQNLRA